MFSDIMVQTVLCTYILWESALGLPTKVCTSPLSSTIIVYSQVAKVLNTLIKGGEKTQVGARLPDHENTKSIASQGTYNIY